MNGTFLILSAAISFASSVAAAPAIPVGKFRSIELSDGGHVVVRHGAVQRVSIVEGDPRYTRVRVDEDQTLIIEDAAGSCPRGYRLEIEVVTPQISAVSISNGGTIQTLGAFPAQESIAAAVEHGGTIDVRSIAADRVQASVYQGGRILTTSQKALSAAVESGGIITYWGDAENVKQVVHGGGAVSRGTARDATKPLSGFGSDELAIPPIPPIPPVPPQS